MAFTVKNVKHVFQLRLVIIQNVKTKLYYLLHLQQYQPVRRAFTLENHFFSVLDVPS